MWRKFIARPVGSDVTGNLDNLHPRLRALLEEIEQTESLAIHVNSGYRNTEKNVQVGGVPHSEHTYEPAEGVDLKAHDSRTRYQLVRAAIRRDVRRIGIGKTFVHLGIGQDKPQDVLWLY